MKVPLRIKILSILFLLLGVAAYFALQERFTTDTITKEDDKIAVSDTAAIQKIIIQKDGQTRILTRTENSGWRINGNYEVRRNIINLLLLGLNQLEVKRPVSQELKATTYDYLKKQGAKVTVEFGDKTRTLFFASNENDVNTTYLLPENSQNPYIAYVPGVPGDINNVFRLQENEWRSRNLFTSNPGEIQNLKVTYPSEPKSSFEIYFQGGNFYVKDVAAPDSARLESYLELYRYVPVSGYLSEGPDSLNARFQKARHYATIDLTDINAGKSNTLLIYQDPASKKEYLGKVGKAGEPVVVNKEIIDRLLIKKAYFTKK